MNGGVRIGARCLVVGGAWLGAEVLIIDGPRDLNCVDPRYSIFWRVEVVDGVARPTINNFPQEPATYIDATKSWNPERWLMPLDPPGELKRLFTSENQGDRLTTRV